MRKGRFIVGIVLLIIGILSLVVSLIDYENLYNLATSPLGALALGTNQTLVNQVNSALGGYEIGIFFGVILAVIGIVLMILGVKGSGKATKVK